MRSQIIRQLRLLHSYRASDPVEEELRGWNYFTPPVKPRRYLGLSIADVAYKYCETKRDVYLRRVLKVQGEQNEFLNHGSSIHRLISSISREILRMISLNVKPWDIMAQMYQKCRKIAKDTCTANLAYCEEVCKAFSFELLSDYADSTSFIPLISEFKVDGSPLGLSSKLSVDAITQLSMVVEIKTGIQQEFHKLALAGYALSLESALNLPIDFGLLIYVNGKEKGYPEIKYEVYYISPDLRKEFLEARDEVIDLITEEKDPGYPTKCSSSCPFLKYCGVAK